MAAKKIIINVVDTENLVNQFAAAKAIFDAANNELERVKKLINAIPEIQAMMTAEGQDSNIALVGNSGTLTIAKSIRETFIADKVREYLTEEQQIDCKQTSVFPRMTHKNSAKFDAVMLEAA
jgi:hypothetical protein